MATELDFLNNATRELFATGGLQNQLYDDMTLMKLIIANGIKEASGRSLLTDVILYREQAGGTFSMYNPIAQQSGNPIVPATLNWANYYQTISISLQEETYNSGGNKQKLVDMIEVRTNNAMSTMKESVYKHFFLALTSLSNGDNTLVGMAAAIAQTNTYANINRSTAGNGGWKSNLVTTAYTDDNLTDPSHAGYFPTLLRNGWLNAAHDKRPNHITMTTRLYEIYQRLAELHNLRLSTEVADLMFKGAKLGGADIAWDKYCTAKSVWGLTTPDWDSYVFPGKNFEPRQLSSGGSWQDGIGQLAKQMQILYMGQVICNVPREQFAYTALGDA